jgi:RNA polymerase sigma-70 factor, ECF subfamily
LKTIKENKPLIIRLRNGDLKAFNELFYAYAPRLRSFMKKLFVNSYKTDEIVQIIFIKIWENRATLNPDLSFHAYLFQAAKNHVYNEAKKELREIKLAQQYLAQTEHSGNYTEDYIVFKELQEQTSISIDSLPPQQKQIFMLSFQDGLSHDEIAAKLNISKRTVENHIYRATKQIKNICHDKDGLMGMIFMAIFPLL